MVIEAIGIPDVDVAGAKPLPDECPARLVQAVPVERTGGRRAHVEHAFDAVRDIATVGIQDARLGARHRRSRGSGPASAPPVGQHHEDRLGGPHAVQDLDAEPLAKCQADLRRQPFARRHRTPHGGKRIGRQPGPEQPSIERRHREEQRRTEARGDLGDGVGLGPTRAQICLRADGERDEERVAERVREEQLRRREDAIGRVGGEHVVAIVAAGEKIAMQMHGGLGGARRARRVEPERHGVEADGLRRELVLRAGDELAEVDDRPQVR